MRHVLMIVIVAAAACGPSKISHNDGGSGTHDATAFEDAPPPPPHTLISLSITPTNPIVQVPLNTPGSEPFTVTGSFADNTQEDVTSQVAWTVANPAVGAIAASTLAIPGFAASTAVSSKLTASLDNVDGLAQITIVANRPQDFFFILPYQDTNGTQTQPLTFATAIPALDVFFDMDVTGSMNGEIANLQSSLTGTVIPGIQAAVANSAFGVGAMADFPVSPYGSPTCGASSTQHDQPFILKQTITTTSSLVQAGVTALSISPGGPGIGCGADLPEAGLESIYQAATGEGLSLPSPTNVPANHTGIGGVGFRTGTMPVIVAISDAPSHGVGETLSCSSPFAYAAPVATYAHSRAQTEAALTHICARTVGIAAIANSCDATEYMTALAVSTGAQVPPVAWDYTGTRPAGCAAGQCCTGQGGVGQAPVAGLCPLVFLASSSGTGVSTSMVTGIQMLTRFATFDVTRVASGVGTDIDGNPLPAGHSTADFLKAIVPASFVLPPPPPVLPNPTMDATTFHNVTPNTKVGFNVDAFNDFVPATDNAQIFHATIQVLAGGCTPLDQRDVIILVPPAPIVIQ
jgi:hypothetical protein